MQSGKIPLNYVPLALMGFVGALVTRLTVLPPQQLASWLGLHPTVASLAVYVAWSMLAAGWLLAQLRRRGLGLAELGWGGRLSPRVAIEAVIAASLAISVWPVVTGIFAAVGVPLYWDPGRRSFINPATPADVVVVAVLGVILVPAVEELLFRGYLLQSLAERLGLWPGLLVHNLTFAGIHAYYGPGLMAYILVWATFPAWLYLRHRSLYPAVLMHALNNVFADLVVPFVFR